MKKKVNINYNTSGEIIEIKIRDYSGRYVESFKFNGSNSAIYGKILEDIYLKYGFKPTIGFLEGVNQKEKAKDKIPTDIFDY